MNPNDSLATNHQVDLSAEEVNYFLERMRKGFTPPSSHAPSPAPSVTPTAEVLLGSISPDEFGVFDESQGWSMNQPGNYENSNIWIYGQNHMYPNTNNMDPRQPPPQWSPYGVHDNFQTGHLHHQETNVAPSK
jgi:hypothetical protein